MRQLGIRISDVAIVALLLGLAGLADLVNRSALPEFDEGVPVTDVLLLAALFLPLLVRRRFPLTVLGAVTGFFIMVRLSSVPEVTMSAIGLFLALFGAGAYSHHSYRDLVRALSVVALMGTLIYGLVTNTEGLPGNVVAYQVFSLSLNVAFFALAWLMGDLWRKRAEDQEELARRAGQLEEQRHLLADQAVANERLRIAQELHDVVGHHVSVMGVQAGAARRSVGTDPDQAVGILESIEDSGRRAVAEMGRLVGLLRENNDHRMAPQPTLGDVDELVSEMRAAGLEVRTHRVGRPRPLEPAADLSAFRIVQESLTNALRHGSRAEAIVELGYLVDHLTVRVRNPASDSSVNGAGRGLIGMQERVTLVGGTIEAGRRADGWFHVEATFPFEASR